MTKAKRPILHPAAPQEFGRVDSLRLLNSVNQRIREVETSKEVDIAALVRLIGNIADAVGLAAEHQRLYAPADYLNAVEVALLRLKALGEQHAKTGKTA